MLAYENVFFNTALEFSFLTGLFNVLEVLKLCFGDKLFCFINSDMESKFFSLSSSSFIFYFNEHIFFQTYLKF